MKPCNCNDPNVPNEGCLCACHEPWNSPAEPITLAWLKDIRETMAAAHEESERSYTESLGKLDDMIRDKEAKTRRMTL